MEGQGWSRQARGRLERWAGPGCCWRREEGGGSETHCRGRRGRPCLGSIATLLSTTKTPSAPTQVARAAEVSGTTHDHPAFHSQLLPLTCFLPHLALFKAVTLSCCPLSSRLSPLTVGLLETTTTKATSTHSPACALCPATQGPPSLQPLTCSPRASDLLPNNRTDHVPLTPSALHL